MKKLSIFLGGFLVIVGVSCDRDFCKDYPQSEFCSPSPPSGDTLPNTAGAFCPDTGRTGYFPMVVGSNWIFHVFEGTSLDADSVTNPTGNEWNEDVSLVDDSTWITNYVGGPYNGLADTAFLFLRQDTLYIRVVRTLQIPAGSTITIAAQIPSAWYPLREGDSTSTPWDTLEYADYVGNDGVPDTIAYRVTTVVLDTSTYTVDSTPYCSQKVLYRTTLNVINWGAQVDIESYFWWTPYVGVVKRIERNFRDTSSTLKWLQKDLQSFTIP